MCLEAMCYSVFETRLISIGVREAKRICLVQLPGTETITTGMKSNSLGGQLYSQHKLFTSAEKEGSGRSCPDTAVKCLPARVTV